MKTLKPTMRERNRYVTFELTCGRKCSRDEMVKAVWNTLLRILGESGTAGLSLWFMDWNEGRQRGILKARHTSMRDMRLGLAMLNKIDESKAAVRVLGVCGTLRKARELCLRKDEREKT